MKNILLAASLLLLNATAHSQGFQIGYAAGLVTNYPDNSQGLNYPANNNEPQPKCFIQNGLYTRYELKNRLALQLNASEYATNYHFFEVDDYPGNASANEPPVSQYSSGIVREKNYLLDISLQVNLNFKKALHNPKFKGVKSYLGVSYTGMIHHIDGQVLTYDAITRENAAFEDRYNVQERAIGINYYGSYTISSHIILSLQASLRMSTQQLTPNDWGNNAQFFTYWGNRVGGYNGDYTSSLCLGLAYTFAKH